MSICEHLTIGTVLDVSTPRFSGRSGEEFLIDRTTLLKTHRVGLSTRVLGDNEVLTRELSDLRSNTVRAHGEQVRVILRIECRPVFDGEEFLLNFLIGVLTRRVHRVEQTVPHPRASLITLAVLVIRVPTQRNASTIVTDGDNTLGRVGNLDNVTVTVGSFVQRIADDLQNGVLSAGQTVTTQINIGVLADGVLIVVSSVRDLVIH